jgi:hypothetical protein
LTNLNMTVESVWEGGKAALTPATEIYNRASKLLSAIM